MGVSNDKYQYNGKEWNSDLGYNMNEMDMRHYDPVIARWVAQDPITHHSFSPYNAFDNNPVFWADPNGAESRHTDSIINENPSSLIYVVDFGGNFGEDQFFENINENITVIDVGQNVQDKDIAKSKENRYKITSFLFSFFSGYYGSFQKLTFKGAIHSKNNLRRHDDFDIFEEIEYKQKIKIADYIIDFFVQLTPIRRKYSDDIIAVNINSANLNGSVNVMKAEGLNGQNCTGCLPYGIRYEYTGINRNGLGKKFNYTTASIQTTRELKGLNKIVPPITRPKQTQHFIKQYNAIKQFFKEREGKKIYLKTLNRSKIFH